MITALAIISLGLNGLVVVILAHEYASTGQITVEAAPRSATFGPGSIVLIFLLFGSSAVVALSQLIGGGCGGPQL